jgi:regulatory associated protein of mTOR
MDQFSGQRSKYRINGDNNRHTESADLEHEFIRDIVADNIVLMEPWHNEFFFEINEESYDENPKELGWRLKERTKTAAAILVVCLNIGTDPPDTVKPNPCARYGSPILIPDTFYD